MEPVNNMVAEYWAVNTLILDHDRRGELSTEWEAESSYPSCGGNIMMIRPRSSVASGGRA